jgi:predicted nucleotide-binding protein (sugar kinase/HSP70/actin superfamily)
MPFTQLSPSPPLANPTALCGRKIWIPRMAAGSVRAFAAVLGSMGLNAESMPPSDERTRELGARYTNGDECYPLKVTLGDALKVLERPDNDPRQTAFFIASGHGPCRFGQYVPYMRAVFASLGYQDAALVSPTFENGYRDFGESANLFARNAWRALVAADLLQKLLFKSRPYEQSAGTADLVYEECISDLCRVLEVPYRKPRDQMRALRESLLLARRRFRELPLRHDTNRPLIGIVGEIFCRLNTFSNEELVRRLEQAGAEVWMNDISEWIWYTNSEQLRRFRLAGQRFSTEILAAWIRIRVQKKDEHELASVFHEDFMGLEEPQDIRIVLEFAEPYLPVAGSSGEMAVNVGKSVYFARKGADGVIDISPFTCMNGIISEAIYPRLSRDNAGIPIRNFYFDGTESDLDRDIGIYLELARSYRRHKPWPRVRPAIV